jgi:hypothetical protein
MFRVLIGIPRLAFSPTRINPGSIASGRACGIPEIHQQDSSYSEA